MPGPGVVPAPFLPAPRPFPATHCPLPCLIHASFLPAPSIFPASSKNLFCQLLAPSLPDPCPFPCHLTDPFPASSFSSYPADSKTLPCISRTLSWQLNAPFPASSLSPSLPAPSPFPCQLTNPFPASSKPFHCQLFQILPWQVPAPLPTRPPSLYHAVLIFYPSIIQLLLVLTALHLKALLTDTNS